LVHGYRVLQNWDQWLAHHFLGSNLIEDEKQILSRLLDRHYGKHALLIGVPHQTELLNATDVPCQIMMSPLTQDNNRDRYIESDFQELPILTGSIDLVMLPHTLEFVDNPRQLLAEACRIVKPEGLIAVCGFNPYSVWGLRKFSAAGNFIPSHKVKGWLQLADFALEQQKTVMFRPPIKQKTWYQKLHFVERLGSKCFPMLGGAYVLLARAKVIPLTPIRMKWKQQLSGIRISTTISGHIVRQSK
jgi:SAM-dependent methyltransferase